MISEDNRYRINFLNDPSLWLLLVSNFIVIFLAIKENWSLLTIMWTYWSQSVIIGFFNFIRIIQLRKFSTKGVKINNRSVSPTRFTKLFIAFFFLFHYGSFHFIYFLVLSSFIKFFSPKFYSVDFASVLIGALLFFLNHLFSYIYNRPLDNKILNIGAVMFYPYARIFPMHITIILSGLFASSKILLFIFLLLKTWADAVMHIIDHTKLRRDIA